MADKPHVTYTVTHQHRHIKPDSAGNFKDHMRVHFHTASGTASHVDVPITHYTAENVHNAVQLHATEIEQVNSLGEGPPPPPAQPGG